MTLSVIQGDLFDPEHRFDALAQGVNCRGLMGAGIAVPFRLMWPGMYEEYEEECVRFPTLVPGTTLVHHVVGTETLPTVRTIYNMFTQVLPGRNADYGLLQSSAYSLLKQVPANAAPQKIGLPWIGCGIGGLEHHNVHHLLAQIWADSEHEFVIVEQESTLSK